VTGRSSAFPVGAAVTDGDLETDLHGTLARLRSVEPVSWIPNLGVWIVTRRDLAVEAMRYSVSFTVDDPRFSTGQVLGPSMLSLDGAQHTRHRDPFADAFRSAEVRQRFTGDVRSLAEAMIVQLRPAARAELRRQFAGPLAVQVMALALDLVDGDPATLLGWYDDIVHAVTTASTGTVHDAPAPPAVAQLAASVRATVRSGTGVLSSAAISLTLDEVVSNTGVMLFGGIETSEGMTTNVLAHLLRDRAWWRAIGAQRSLISGAIDESLRLEPAATRVDRFATRDIAFGGAPIQRGDFVIISLAAANRDPATFADPDRFDPTRANAKQHLAFAHGPHACPGMHLARLETQSAVAAALDGLPGLRLDPMVVGPQPVGTVFRKPDRLDVIWDDH
jgi:cytochrome P450